MKILVLFTRLTGYWLACMKFDHEKTGNEYLVIRKTPSSEAPFSISSENGISIINGDEMFFEELFSLGINFNPDIVYLAGWSDVRYKKLGLHFKSLNKPVVMGMDNQWLGSFKQIAASLFSPFLIKKFCTHIWVPGKPQIPFAKKLGFQNEKILTGLYCADVTSFKKVVQKHFVPQITFIGRLVEHKGLKILFSVLNDLINESSLHFKVKIIGNGPLVNQIPIHPNIEHIAFLNPDQLPEVLENAGFFILPSLYEAWGVVLHEAVLAGLPVISTAQTGAVSEFVIDDYNGFLYDAVDKNALKSILQKISTLSNSRYFEMSRNSKIISRKITLDSWSSTINSLVSDQT